MGGADGGGARVEGCGEDAVLVERAFGAVFEVLSERRGRVKRKHSSIGLGMHEAAAPKWTTLPSGPEKFTPSRSEPGSEGGFRAGRCLGVIQRLLRGSLGHAGGWPSPWVRRFCVGASSSPRSKIGDFDAIRPLRRRRCGGLRVWRVRLTWLRAPLFGNLRVTGWSETWAPGQLTRKQHDHLVAGLAE